MKLYNRLREIAILDWTIMESRCVALCVEVKRTLRKYGYPPDMEKFALDTVIKQAELLAEELTER